jgi:hypothetical protein
MCLLGTINYKKKYLKKFFFASFKSLKKGVGDPDPGLSVRGTDPGIQIRTKMSQIPNSDAHCVPVGYLKSGTGTL